MQHRLDQPLGLAGRRPRALTQRRAAGTGCSRKTASVMTREGAEGADQQLAEVVAGDVLDHPAAGLGDHAVGADHRDADQQVARGAGGDAARPAGVGGERPADAGAGHGLVEREPLAAAADDLLHVGQPGARLGHDDQVTGGVVEHLVEAR